jgi:hypothetical protein
VIDNRQPVPEGFEILPECDLFCGRELFKAASFDFVDQTIECVVEGVDGQTER